MESQIDFEGKKVYKQKKIPLLKEKSSELYSYLDNLAQIEIDDPYDLLSIQKAKELLNSIQGSPQWEEGIDYIAEIEFKRRFSTKEHIKQQTTNLMKQYGLLNQEVIPERTKSTFICNDCEKNCEVIELYKKETLIGRFGDYCKKYLI